MAQLRVHNMSMSVDGFVAGPDQSLDDPLGVGAEPLHEWMFETKRWSELTDETGGEAGVDDDVVARGFDGIGAWILGRNMFGPIRGPWGDSHWSGWWGDEPPYHCPVFVLTHHARDPLEMAGGTTFHFVDDPIERVLARAFEAADGRDVRLGGGASTVRQYMASGLVDYIQLTIVPVLLGGGERIFEPNDRYGRYECAEFIPSRRVAHVVLTPRADR